MNEYRKVEEGFDIIDALGLHFGMWPCIGVLLAIGLLCRILAIIALK